MSRSKHATAFNEQAGIQRDAIAPSDGKMGASRTTMSTIFSSTAPTPAEVMTRALNAFKNTGSPSSETPITAEIASGQNFDFFNGLTGSFLRFQAGADKFSVVKGDSISDRPNTFGPNLSVPNIANPPLKDGDDAVSSQINSPTFDSIGSAGFGVSIDRNNPDSNTLGPDSGQGTFLTRRGASVGDSAYTSRGSNRNILGEYINSDLYGYSQPADNIVLGTEEPED
tara:strand:- start:118 stop:795 length:678 start_codon:yes stop_codon:yes gene_type:complete